MHSLHSVTSCARAHVCNCIQNIMNLSVKVLTRKFVCLCVWMWEGDRGRGDDCAIVNPFQ